MIEVLPQSVSLNQVEIWFQDETRVGQQGSLTRIWAQKGTRPRVNRQQQFLNAYIFGAVCPERDQGAAIVLPYANIASMKEHLNEISSLIPQGRHGVIVMDQARWHVSNNLHIPENISLLPLPPYSPELNPQENVWQYLKQSYLANRTFDSFDDIVDACCYAWNQFVDRGNNISNMCTRSWAKVSG